MRSTAIFNLKGGVAKTTTAIHLAKLLNTHHGARVLLIDCDPQCNLTQFFGADPRKGSTTQVLLDGSEFCAINSIQPTGMEGVDIIAADDMLMELDLSQIYNGRVMRYVFRKLALELERRETYDYVIYDCPPAFNGASAAALIGADDVVIPIKLDAFSVAGMANVLQQIRNMKRISPRLSVAGILPTMWYRDIKILESEELLRRSNLPIYPHIRRSDKVDGFTFTGEFPNAKVRHMVDYKRFTKAYLEGRAQ